MAHLQCWHSNNRLSFPLVLPFSQMYPLCCIDIRNFLNQIYLFSDENFQRTTVIDETLREVSESNAKIRGPSLAHNV